VIPEQYCLDKVAAPGGSYYYSTLFLPPERKSALHGLFALRAEIGEIPRSCSDPGVARIKLQWWRDELARACAGEPRHPVTTHLRPFLQTHALERQDFLAIIEATERELNHPRYAAFADLEAQALALGGALWALSCRVCGFEDPQTPQAVRELGGAIELAARLQDLRDEARRGHVPLPAQELAERGISLSDLTLKPDSAPVRELLAAHVERIRVRLDAATRRIPRRDQRRQVNALIMARLQLATLEEIQRDGCRLLTHSVTLTPLRKLWIAWRTLRRVG
jgi:phytoene synthase